jgi:hypothetical protein
MRNHPVPGRWAVLPRKLVMVSLFAYSDRVVLADYANTDESEVPLSNCSFCEL